MNTPSTPTNIVPFPNDDLYIDDDDYGYDYGDFYDEVEYEDDEPEYIWPWSDREESGDEIL